MMNNKIKKEGK